MKFVGKMHSRHKKHSTLIYLPDHPTQRGTANMRVLQAMQTVAHGSN